MASSLLSLSIELLDLIFLEIELADLFRLSQTCRTLNSHVGGNERLFKKVLQRTWGDPPQIDSWQGLGKKIVKAEEYLRRSPKPPHEIKEFEEKKSMGLRLVSEVVDVFLTAASRQKTQGEMSDLFSTANNFHCFLTRSWTFNTMPPGRDNHPDSEDLDIRQASAKLHVLSNYNSPPQDYARHRQEYLDRPPQPATIDVVRALVYDLRQYPRGPHKAIYDRDQRAPIDWEKLEAIMALTAQKKLNLRCSPRPFKKIKMNEAEWPSLQRYNFPPPLHDCGQIDDPYLQQSLDSQDPYGVTGTWHRLILYLPYFTFDSYNRSNLPESSNGLRPIRLGDECHILVRMKLRVTEIVPPQPGDHPSLPVVKFIGTSQGLTGIELDPDRGSTIEGHVSASRQGDVIWRLDTTLQDQQVWASNGLQVGGPQSQGGVLGVWFDREIEDRPDLWARPNENQLADPSPVGPCSYWKVSNELTDDLPDECFEFDEKNLESVPIDLYARQDNNSTEAGSWLGDLEDEDEDEDEDFDEDDEDDDDDDVDGDEDDDVEVDEDEYNEIAGEDQ